MLAPYHNAKLCFINEEVNKAYFTTCPLEEQSGDDWHKSPYQCNASLPDPEHYPGGYSKDKKEVPHDLFEVTFDKGPNYGCPAVEGYRNGPGGWSVEFINSGAMAWLATTSYEYDNPKPVPPIMAGATYDEFVNKIVAGGGMTFLPVKNIRTGEYV